MDGWMGLANTMIQYDPPGPSTAAATTQIGRPPRLDIMAGTSSTPGVRGPRPLSEGAGAGAGAERYMGEVPTIVVPFMKMHSTRV